jgi:hypothetical protein
MLRANSLRSKSPLTSQSDGRRCRCRIAANVRVAWPHDGGAREAGSGEPLANLYKQEGLQTLPSHATHASGG